MRRRVPEKKTAGKGFLWVYIKTHPFDKAGEGDVLKVPDKDRRKKTA